MRIPCRSSRVRKNGQRERRRIIDLRMRTTVSTPGIRQPSSLKMQRVGCMPNRLREQIQNREGKRGMRSLTISSEGEDGMWYVMDTNFGHSPLWNAEVVCAHHVTQLRWWVRSLYPNLTRQAWSVSANASLDTSSGCDLPCSTNRFPQPYAHFNVCTSKMLITPHCRLRFGHASL